MNTKSYKLEPFKAEELQQKLVVLQKGIRFCRFAEMFQATCLIVNIKFVKSSLGKVSSRR